MQEKQSKHPLLKWILWKYVKILVIPLFQIILLNVNTLMSVIQNFNETLDPSLAQPTTDNVTVNHTPLKNIVDTMNQYIPIISLGLFVLAFMYAMSFTTTLLYQRIKPDSRYFYIELYKQSVSIYIK